MTDLDALARVMDSAVEVPGVKIKFGLDAVLGLIPGVGDLATSVASLYILGRAHRMGVGRATLARMVINILIDLLVGVVPVAGDVVDVFWKANRRNVALLQRHAHATPQRVLRLRWADRAFVGGAIVLVVSLTIASAVASYYVIAWMLSAGRQLLA